MWGFARCFGLLLALGFPVSVLGTLGGCSGETPVAEAPEGAEVPQDLPSPGAALEGPKTGLEEMGKAGDQTEAIGPDGSQNAQTPEMVYRPMDDRIRHDDAALARVGIQTVSSRRLILYSDLPIEKIAHLPPLVDQLYEVLAKYFGELPPDRLGEDWQITGYLMADEDLFRQAGLLIEHLPLIEHGLHRGRRFWMRNQTYDYYQAHLLLHEATHCFMTTLRDSEGPIWYMEGMAEYFALHRVEPSGKTLFGIRPPEPEEILGFDRVEVVRADVRSGRERSLDQIANLTSSQFRQKDDYAWAWALCWFLNHHPRYQERFQSISAPALRTRFRDEIARVFAAERELLPVEWSVFAREISPDFDFARMTIDLPTEAREVANGPLETRVAASRGWQPTGWRVEAGKTYRLSGEGRVVLDTVSRPWESYPAGISFDFARGKPLGLLQAAILDDSGDGVPRGAARGLLSPVDVGESVEWTPETTGQLFLRINDHAHDLENNQGEYRVSIEAAMAP